MKKIHPVKFVLIISFVIISLACCMLPKLYEGSIEQTQQEGIIIYDKGIQDLILKVDPKISGEAKLDNICWLITVPNEPDKYAVCEKSIFQTMYELRRLHLVKPRRNTSIGCSKSSEDKLSEASKALPGGVELGKFVQVGEYDIQPVRGVGENAFKGLNTWLEQNGFPTEPEDHMKYFIDKKFTFLCIKVNSKKDGLPKRPELKPLHLTFKSDQVYYPMKYSSQQGDFSANIYTITSMPIDFTKSADVLNQLDWSNKLLKKNINLAKKTIPDDLSKILGTKERPYLYFNNFNCARPNKDKAISKWTEDIYFKLNDSHWPNAANRMAGIDWPRTGLLAAILLIVAIVAIRKWKKTYSS